jgi:hypothetical protein
VYLIKKIKRKALTGKEIIKITFGVIAVIIIIFSIAGCVIKTKDLNMIDVLYVNQIKINKREFKLFVVLYICSKI